MRAGKLQHRIQIERAHVLVDDYGIGRESWLPILTTRAELKEASTTEFLTGPGEMDNRKAVFLIRYPQVEITTADRLVMDGKAYNIVGLAEIGRIGAIGGALDIDRAAVLDAQLRRLEEEEQRGIPEANRARQKRSLQARKRRLVKTANDYGLWLDDDQQAT